MEISWLKGLSAITIREFLKFLANLYVEQPARTAGEKKQEQVIREIFIPILEAGLQEPGGISFVIPESMQFQDKIQRLRYNPHVIISDMQELYKTMRRRQGHTGPINLVGGFLTTAEAVEYSGLSADHLRALARNNKITAVRSGRTWRFANTSLSHYLRVHGRPPRRAPHIA